MKIVFKGVFTLDEHLLILGRLKHEIEGNWMVTRSESTHVPMIKRVN